MTFSQSTVWIPLQHSSVYIEALLFGLLDSSFVLGENVRRQRPRRLWRISTKGACAMKLRQCRSSVTEDRRLLWIPPRWSCGGRNPELDPAFPQRAVVLLARILHQLAVGQRERALVRPRLRVVDRVVDGHRVGDVPGVGARNAASGAACRCAGCPGVEPREAVEADGVDDQRVAVPLGDRFAEPGRVRLGRVRVLERHDVEPGVLLEQERDVLSVCMIWIGYGALNERVRPNGMHMPV